MGGGAAKVEAFGWRIYVNLCLVGSRGFFVGLGVAGTVGIRESFPPLVSRFSFCPLFREVSEHRLFMTSSRI
jgi:hypothetical protein